MTLELSSLSDEKLMAMVAQGNHSALGELYSRHGRLVRVAIQHTVPGINQDDVEELCHDVFLVLNDSASKYEERTKFKSWLYSVATRQVKHWNRKRLVRRRLLGQEFQHRQQTDSAQGALSAEVPLKRHVVDNAMAKLSQKLRTVFWLHTVEGFTAPEIGHMLGVSEDVVWTRLHRARKRLYKMLREDRHG